MNDESRADPVRALTAAAERLDELADTAELMGDDNTVDVLRRQAANHRAEALGHLDHRGDHGGEWRDRP